MFRSIQRKLILLMLIPVFLTALIGSSLSSMQAYDSAVELMETRSIDITEAYAANLEMLMKVIRQQAEAVAQINELADEGTTEEQRSAAVDHYVGNKKIRRVRVYTADGTPEYTGGEAAGSIHEGDPWFPRARNGETVVADVYSGQSGVAQVSVYTPLAVRGGMDGVVIVDYDLDDFDQVVADIQFGETGTGFLIDGSGTIIAHEQSAVLGKTASQLLAEDPQRYASLAQALETMRAEGTGSLEFDLDGERYASFEQIDSSEGWIIAATASKDEYFAPFHRALLVQISFAVTFIVAGAVLAILFGRRMSRPLQFVSRRVAALEQGDLAPVEYRHKGRDEIATLVASLTKTIDSLRLYIGETARVLNEIARGNIDIELTDAEYPGEFSQVQISLNTIVNSLNEIMGEIGNASQSVSASSQQLASVASELSNGAVSQASSSENVTGAVDSSARQLTDAAQQTSQAAQQTIESVAFLHQTQGSMERMLHSMAEIEAASRSIGGIMRTIEDIAFQTNILALNASVEAARAGQSGKGFSVVADEVRNLAAKSADASQATNKLIATAQKAVREGVKIAEETAQGISDTTERAEQTANLIRSVESMVAHVSDVFRDLDGSVRQINSVVQANSSTAQQTAAASEELSSQSLLLHEMVGRLHLREQNQPAFTRPTHTEQGFAAKPPPDRSHSRQETQADAVFVPEHKY